MKEKEKRVHLKTEEIILNGKKHSYFYDWRTNKYYRPMEGFSVKFSESGLPPFFKEVKFTPSDVNKNAILLVDKKKEVKLFTREIMLNGRKHSFFYDPKTGRYYRASDQFRLSPDTELLKKAFMEVQIKSEIMDVKREEK